jgi:hypothetical protein
MSIMSWLKRTAQPSHPAATGGGERSELTPDLKTERLRRAVRDFPGRQDADLARIIYGRDDAGLVAADGRRLEAEGHVVRDPETGGLYATRRGGAD